MADRVYPSTKPPSNPPPQTLNGTTTAAAAKPQLYGATRPAYRPQPHHRPRRRTGRSCLCQCCVWFTLLLIALLLLAAIAGAAVYVLYRPHRPTFSISTLKISQLNFSTTAASASSHLFSHLDLTVSAKNPNSKLTFFYDPITITVLSDDVVLGNGSFPSFTHAVKNTTLIRSPISTSRDLDTESVTTLRSDLKKKNGLPLKVQLDMKVKVKMGALKSEKVGIRVSCEGIHGALPKGKSPSVASTSDAECEVDLRVKIWKWTF